MRSLELFGAELWSDREFLFGSRWNIEHRIHHYCFYNRAQAACSELEFDCLVDYIIKGLGFEYELDTVHVKQFFVLFCNGVFRFGEYSSQGIAVERQQMSENRQSAYDFGD